MTEPIDPFQLSRFVHAQTGCFDTALRELRALRKQSHWMWFIFPQVRGLGHSELSIRFAISSAEEAEAYLAHPILGPRLAECCEVLERAETQRIRLIFEYPDDMKLRSCLTLFAHVSQQDSIFARLIVKYFEGVPDARTLQLIEAHH